MAQSHTAFTSLVFNAALLLVLVLVYDLLARHLRRQSLTFKLLTGLVLGIIAIAVMVASFHVSGGVIFDTRTVLLSMGTLFYGTLPGLIAGVVAGVYRLGEGGSGVVMGVSTIVMAVAVGALWRRWRRIAQRDPSVLELYLFGLTVHVFMLALTATLPHPMATLRVIAAPVIVIYPLASVLVGLLMIDARRRLRGEAELRENEARYRSLFEDSPVAMWEEDDSAVKARLEELAADGIEDIAGYLLTHADEYARCLSLSRGIDANRAAVELFEARDRDELVARTDDLYRRQHDRGVYRFWAGMLTGQRSVTFEELNVSLAGRELYILETCTVVPGHEDSYDRVYVADVDVTERKHDREKLRLSAERLRQTLDGMVQAMGQLVDARDPYTAGHERRVALLACAIAARLGWGEEQSNELRTAALVHDIGKISIPSEILSKPGQLSETEFSLIKDHPRTAHEILAPIAFPGRVAEIVLQHHERLDGSGYPGGLRGAAILPAARVLAVADVYEAMVSHRPYRPALPAEDALAELLNGAGVRYDAEVVEACLALVKEEFDFTTADA